MKEWTVWSAIMLGLVLASTLTGCDDDFKTMCEDLGGVVKTDTKVIQTTAYDTKGRPIFGTSLITIKFCIKDGEVVAQS